ncbi:metallophosphoesterase [Bacillus spizizenii]|nr:metallophosphoesterase [Bacillus spizizenii]MCY8890526.1 metallophosphoesterase [Bacillus spizizenii]MEC0841982.1 metallophosphoesterase [Bacillus spizizenii]
MGRIKPEYMQRPEEDTLDWKYRLILGKANKEVKLNWNEIANLLGLNCSGEYLRKTAYGILEYVRWQEEQQLQNEDEDTVFESIEAINKLEEKRMALERTKIQAQDQKRQVKALLREWARAEKIKDDIQKAVADVAKMKPIKIKPKTKTSNHTREGAVLFSDWHRGTKSNHYWNLFTDVEYEKRIKKLVEKTIIYGHEQKIKTLHVFLMGDLINGLIHVTTRIENMEDIVKSTKVVAETIAQVLAKFADEFDEIKVYSARGNHDRVTPNKAESVSKESFFDFIPWYLEARVGHIENIEFKENEYDDEIIVTEICGQNVFAVHGHKDKMNNVVSNLSQMIKIFPDYVFMGHYHHHEENEFHMCEVIINSSLSGTDEYAKDLRRTSKAAQKFIIFDKGEGRLCTYNIRLD